MVTLAWTIPMLLFFPSILGWDFITSDKRSVAVLDAKRSCVVGFAEWHWFNIILTVSYYWVTLIVMLTLYLGIYRIAVKLSRRAEAKHKKTAALVAQRAMAQVGISGVTESPRPENAGRPPAVKHQDSSLADKEPTSSSPDPPGTSNQDLVGSSNSNSKSPKSPHSTRISQPNSIGKNGNRPEKQSTFVESHNPSSQIENKFSSKSIVEKAVCHQISQDHTSKSQSTYTSDCNQLEKNSQAFQNANKVPESAQKRTSLVPRGPCLSDECNPLTSRQHSSPSEVITDGQRNAQIENATIDSGVLTFSNFICFIYFDI